MRPRGEELRDTGSVEASLGETEGSAQTGTTSTDDDGIVLVVDDGVLARDEAGSLLSTQVLGRDDAGGRPRRGEGALGCAEALRELAGHC